MVLIKKCNLSQVKLAFIAFFHKKVKKNKSSYGLSIIVCADPEGGGDRGSEPPTP